MFTMIKICLSIIVLTILWVAGLIVWIVRNPEKSDKVKAHEIPYPWFFYTFVGLYYLSRVALIFLAFYAVYLVMGWLLMK